MVLLGLLPTISFTQIRHTTDLSAHQIQPSLSLPSLTVVSSPSIAHQTLSLSVATLDPNCAFSRSDALLPFPALLLLSPYIVSVRNLPTVVAQIGARPLPPDSTAAALQIRLHSRRRCPTLRQSPLLPLLVVSSVPAHPDLTTFLLFSFFRFAIQVFQFLIGFQN